MKIVRDRIQIARNRKNILGKSYTNHRKVIGNHKKIVRNRRKIARNRTKIMGK